ncbi:MAG: acyl-CoA dehydrogenase family protein [Pseudomonadota bacterium]
MDFELSEEQRAFRDLAHGFAAEKMAPFAADWDEGHVFPVATQTPFT